MATIGSMDVTLNLSVRGGEHGVVLEAWTTGCGWAATLTNGRPKLVSKSEIPVELADVLANAMGFDNGVCVTTRTVSVDAKPDGLDILDGKGCWFHIDSLAKPAFVKEFREAVELARRLAQ